MESHLLQMRGLKPKLMILMSMSILSHLLQMRGLKPWDEENEENEDSRIFYRCVD